MSVVSAEAMCTKIVFLPLGGGVGTGLEHTLLCPSPLAEPAERIARNGLPRLHSLDGSQTVG